MAAVWAFRIICWCCCIGSNVADESADSMQKIDVDEAVVAAVLSEAEYVLCAVGVGIGRLAAFLVQKVSQLCVVANGVLEEMQADSDCSEWLPVISVASLVQDDLGDVHCILIFLTDNACGNNVAIFARR